MSQPIRHHYLPKKAYLKFFESQEKRGFIWMYQRKQEPLLISIENVAKEKHLYSFVDEKGQYDTQLESALGEMEQSASTVIKKLNDSHDPAILPYQDKVELSYFLAMQFARTPGFRDLLKKQAAEFAKFRMKTLASNEKALARALNKIRKEKPGAPEISVQEMQEFIMGDKYTVEMGNENYFLKQAIQVGHYVYPSFMAKDMFILRSQNVELITSDYPVILIPDPRIPSFYAGGFLMSGILVPISTNTALFFKNSEDPATSHSKEENFRVGYGEIPASDAREINKMIINHAERFLFGAVNNQKIKKLFDRTSKPKRFDMSMPFSRTHKEDK